MRKVLFAALFLFLFLSSHLFVHADVSASTDVSGTIDGETWTAANSPYNVVGNIDVVSLTIEPGVTISLQGDYVFEVSGSLTAVGTEGNEILFTRSTSGWQGIYLNNSPDEMVLAHVRIENATNSGVRIVGSQATLSDCTFSNNSASYGGAIYADGAESLTITDCLFSNNSAYQGGAIYVGGASSDVDIENSRFADNTLTGGNTAGGGAILLGNGTTEIKSSSFTNNSASGYSTQYGGGLAVYGGTGSVSNSTFNGNYSQEYGGGIYVSSSASLALTGSVVASNDGAQGGGIYSNGTLTLLNTTVVLNQNEGIWRQAGTTTVQNSIVYFNLGAEMTGAATVSYSNIQGGVAGTGNIDANPNFAEYVHYTLSASSPSVDAGHPGSLFNDACFPPSRGATRNDMGAYGGPKACGWLPENNNLVVWPPRFAVTLPEGASGSQELTIANRSVQELAWQSSPGSAWLNASPISGTVPSDDSTFVTMGLDASALTAGTYSDLLTIIADDPISESVEVPVELTVSEVSNGTDVEGVIIGENWTTAGSPYNVVGDIYVVSLTIEPGVVVEFQGAYEFEVSGRLTAIGTPSQEILFTRNTFTWPGIYLNNSPDENELAYVRVENANNSGMRIVGGQTVIRNCTLTNNSASYGGAINANEVDSLTITDCLLSNNSAYQGGAIYVGGASSDVGIENSRFADNTLTGGNTAGGGAILLANGTTEIKTSSLTNNSASGYSTQYGGGLAVYGGTASVINSTFSGNYSQEYGGGIYVSSSASLALTGSVVASNDGAQGGGIYSNGTLTLVNTTVVLNQNEGIWRQAGTTTVQNSIVYFNLGAEMTGAATVSYSNIQGGVAGTGNIDANPNFAEYEYYTLSATSSSVDAGSPELLFNDDCFPPSLGSTRNDMGAYGGPTACAWLPDNNNLVVWPPSFALSLPEGGSNSQVLTIANRGTQALDWQIGSSSAWLTASPLSGALSSDESAQVTVSLDATALTAGTYTSLLTITSDEPGAESIEVPVSLTVNEVSNGTNVSGLINGERWTLAGSPYNVTDDLYVVSLVIEPGVVVSLQGDYQFEVGGGLTAVGTPSQEILFTRSTFGWPGLYLNHSPDENELGYVRIENATNSGMRIVGGQTVLRNCTLTNNSASYGGAIYANEVDSLTITDCLLSNNSAFQGGAIYVSGASSDVRIENSRFADNTLTGGNTAGGGAILLANGTTEIKTSSLSNNSASGYSTQYGGGLAVYGGTASVINSTVGGNYSQEYGGGIYVSSSASLALTGSVVASNDGAQGGGIYSNGTLTLVNTTVVLNQNEGIWRQAGTTTVQNSIVYFNLGAEMTGAATVSYSNIQGGVAGTGNIDANPNFAEYEYYTLSATSSSVDAGNPELLFNDACFPPSLGSTRNDMGAYGGPNACGLLPENNNLVVWPPRFAISLPEGEISSQALTIANRGTQALDWQIGSSSAWLTASPLSGALSSDESAQVTVSLDATALTAGTYTTLLTITSDEPGAESIEVPVSLTVNDVSNGTNVSGVINGESWTLAGSPYNVTGDLYVISLTIEPGVVVSFQDAYEFEVAGLLSAVGTEDNQILFTRSTFGWPGLYLNHSPDENELGYVRIENATNSGMRIVGGQTLLRNCTLTNNSASYGGAINANEVDSLTITDCLFSNNSAYQGGAIYVGGASSEVQIEKSHLTLNTLTGGNTAGGGAILLANGTTEIKSSTLTNNSASGYSTQYGGGLAIYGGTAEIINSLFSDNFSEEYGGGIYLSTGTTALLINSIVAQNDVNAQGDGIYTNGTLTLKNTSIVANEGEGLRRGNGTLTVQNSIVYFNTGSEIVGSATVTHSDIEGGFAGTGNINADPLFVDVANGDLHLLVDSPAIDVADNSALPPDTQDLDGDGNTTEPIPYDLDGAPRLINGVVDMGAYEYISALEPNINVAPASLSVTLAEGESTSESLTISNNGTTALNFNVTVSDTTWLNTSPTSGTVPASQSTALTVNLDASGLTIGVYTNTLTITSNDPDQPQVVVEVILTVGNEPLISDIRLSNVRDVSFTVSWLTDIESTSSIRYGTSPDNLNQIAYDERGVATFDDTHIVTINGLNASTTYYFDVLSGSITDNNNGTHYSVSTGATLDLPSNDLIFGQVKKSDGSTVAEGTIVYITLENTDGAGSTGEAAPLSAVVDSNGYWSTDLGNARTADLSDYFSYSNSGDLLLLEAEGAADGVGCQRVDTSADSPAADILLNGSPCATTWSMNMQSGWNHISLPLAPVSPFKAADACLDINTQGGDVVEIDRWYAAGWEGHICDYTFSNFDMVLGSDYFIKSNIASNWAIEGYQVTEPVSLTLEIGWNSIGIPHSDNYIASSLCDDIISQGISLVEVTRWHNGGWNGHLCAYPFNDFDIERGTGYFIKTTSSGTVTPTLPASPLRQPEEVVTITPDELPASPSLPVHDLRQSNLRDTSVTLSWTTEQATTGYVRLLEAAEERIAVDSRGATTSSTTHHVILDNLTPETTYHFEIMSGAEAVERGTFTTLASLTGIPDSDTIYGQLLHHDGTTPAAGTLVYLTLQDADGTDSQGEARLLSALTDAEGYWHTNLGNARGTTNDDSFTYSETGDTVVLSTQSTTHSTTTTTLDTSHLRPAAPIILKDSGPWQLYLPLINH